jgi:hypothetical protein
MAKQHASGIIISMPITENQSYLDTLDDEVGQAVRRIDYTVNQTQHRKNKQAIVDALQKGEFEVFGFRKHRMDLEQVNQSVLIKIGPKKRGHLAPYRGSWVRVVWLSTYGGYTMNCAVQKLTLSEAVESSLIPCGPYTKEQFTEDVATRHPHGHVIVDDQRMMRLKDGRWIRSTPTAAALRGEETDEIPDGWHGYLPDFGSFRKHAGRWVSLMVTQAEYDDGAGLELPLGTVIYVEGSQRKVRTENGWKDTKKY